jgi:hypothetical protein
MPPVVRTVTRGGTALGARGLDSFAGEGWSFHYPSVVRDAAGLRTAIGSDRTLILGASKSRLPAPAALERESAASFH